MKNQAYQLMEETIENFFDKPTMWSFVEEINLVGNQATCLFVGGDEVDSRDCTYKISVDLTTRETKIEKLVF